MYTVGNPRTEAWPMTRMEGSIEIGQRLAAARKRAGLTQNDLGRYVGMDGSSIASIETGRRDTRMAKMAAMCEALGVSLAEVMDGPSIVPMDVPVQRFAPDDVNPLEQMGVLRLRAEQLAARVEAMSAEIERQYREMDRMAAVIDRQTELLRRSGRTGS